MTLTSLKHMRKSEDAPPITLRPPIALSLSYTPSHASVEFIACYSSCMPGLVLDHAPGTSKFELSLTISGSEPLSGQIEYSTDLFEPDTIARLAEHLLVLVEAAASAPTTPARNLPIMNEAERHQVTVEWNKDTVAPFPSDKCVHELFEEQAIRTPTAVAVVFEGSEVTYAELDARAGAVARRLKDLGVVPNTLVGLLVERSVEMMVGMMGILKAGGAFVPIDPAYPAARIRLYLQDSGATILVTTQECLGNTDVDKTLAQVLMDAAEFGHAAWSRGELLSGHEARVKSNVGVEDLSYVIYTSGSTGRPKGVLLHHKGWNNTNSWTIRDVGLLPGKSWLCVTTVCFDIAMVELMAPLQIGMHIVIANRQECTHTNLLKELFDRTKPNISQATSSRWRMLVDVGWSGNGTDGPDMVAIQGGEVLTPALNDALQARCSIVYNGYGPTEATIYSTWKKCSSNEPVTLGNLVKNRLGYVVDDQTLTPVPIGVPGELLLGGVGIARGYHNRSDLNDERFIQSPFPPLLGLDAPDESLFRTGDLVRWLPNSELEFLGRIDFQVKLRGFRVELGEVEAALTRHGGAEQACVLAVKDNTILVAFVTPSNADVKAIRDGVRAELPRYMVPSGKASSA